MYDIAGWVGAVAYIVAYGMVALRKIKAEKKLFHLLNMAGAVGVTIAAWHNGDMPSIGLNVAWGLIALYGATRPSLD